jgi:hypothetical protein
MYWSALCVLRVHGAEEGGHGRHHDGAEAQDRLVDRLERRELLVALRLDREVDHHDGVFLTDTDEEDDADEADDRQVELEDEERQERAHVRRWQGREDGAR